MSTLLVLVFVMGGIVLNRVGKLFSPGAPAANVPTQPTGNSITLPSQTIVTEPGHEHNMVKGKTYKATCDMQGYTIYECACGKAEIQDLTDPLGHQYGQYTVVAATCAEDGWTERTCTRCDKVERTDVTTAAHNFNRWVSLNDLPQEQHTCKVCATTEIRSTDAEQTWLLQVAPKDFNGPYTWQKVTVILEEDGEGTTYDVYTASDVTYILFDYTEKGLTMYYSAGEAQSYLFSADDSVLTVEADGTTTDIAPEETQEPDAPGADEENPDPGTNEDSTDEEQTPSDDVTA